MNTFGSSVRDTATLLRRDFRHQMRYPVMTISAIMTPLVFLLLFAFVFGGTLGSSLGAVPPGTSYITYILPAIVLMAVGGGGNAVAVELCTDMTEGLISRLRVMPIYRSAVLTGKVLGSLIRTVLSVTLIIGIGLLLGFRSSASPLYWLGAFGLIVLLGLAIAWLAVAVGLVNKTVGGANGSLLPLQILPLVSSGFTPTSSMPAGVRWFAEHQPYTPIIDTLRGLLLGKPVSSETALLAVGWCLLIALLGYLWARAVYNRDPVS